MYEQLLQSVVGTLSLTAGADPISLILAASALGAAIATFSGFGAAVGQGIAVGKAVEAIGRQPESAGQVRSTLILGCAIAESGAIYGLFVAIMLLFVNPFIDMYINAIQRL